jgi:hypothetical protein
MSEPLTSHEIEDVLSSIRRLVSEDLRPARAAMAAAKATRAAPEAEKLLLTPALRVVPDVVAEPGPDASPAPDAVVTDVDDLASDFARSFEVSLPGRADVSDEPLGLGPDLAAAFPDATAEIYDDAGLGDEAPLSPMMAATDDVLWAAPGELDPGEAELAEDLVAAAPASVTQVHGHWTAQDLPGVDWVEEESDWAEPAPIPFVAYPRKPDLTVDPLARAWADRAEEAVRAELDEVVSAKATAVPPPSAPESQAETARGPGLFDGDEAELDEETLREIVRDIIREELAGALGERITRNVRKLVRVEINRALTAREFE